jgi:hypothetical protein
VYDLQSSKLRGISKASGAPILAKKKNDHQNFVGYWLPLKLAAKEVAEKLGIEPCSNVNHDLHLTLFEYEVDN